ncbi:MAG TPA: FAD-dependent monooxygenase, partial [Polyangiaceae bacterium]|nr:FAD-dependent monooxygenase [Polyangiaceae bacterium]
MPSGRTVSICGGGLGGLTLGLALRKYGIPFQIFERAPALSEIGAGITLWSNAIAVLRHLGVAEAVRAVSEPSPGGMIGLSGGEILVEAQAGDVGDGLRPLELWAAHRFELQQALYDQLPRDAVHFAAPFLRYSETATGVVAQFGSWGDVESSLLVGADGIGS